MFSHIFVSVSDFERAVDFYNQVLTQLGITPRFCEPDKPWAGWHSAGHARPYFVICHPFDGKAHDPGNGQMVAFTAADREQVRSAYQTAIALGVRCEGEPGLRPHYHEHYYGAYFRDLDGNKVCVACHKPDSISAAPQAADTLRILAVSGSLRAASINTAFLLAVAQVMPHDVQVTMYQGLDLLPMFNPDLETNPPEQALRWRDSLDKADALLIASPEYAHGITGTMKNALDWLVSHEPIVNKPVAVVNTSDRARHADAALRETLITMNADLVASASITVPLLGTQINIDELHRTQLVNDAAVTIAESMRHAVRTRQLQVNADTSSHAHMQQLSRH